MKKKTKFYLFAVITVLFLFLFAVPSLAINDEATGEEFHVMAMSAGFIDGFHFSLDFLSYYFQVGFTEDNMGLATGINLYLNDYLVTIDGLYVGAGFGFTDYGLGLDLRAGYKLWLGHFFLLDGGYSTICGGYLNLGIGI